EPQGPLFARAGEGPRSRSRAPHQAGVAQVIEAANTDDEEDDGAIALPEDDEEPLQGEHRARSRRRTKSRLLPRSARMSLRRLGRRISHPTKVAWADWGAGMMIGLMPLLCHAILHVAARPPPDWDDNWSPDLLF